MEQQQVLHVSSYQMLKFQWLLSAPPQRTLWLLRCKLALGQSLEGARLASVLLHKLDFMTDSNLCKHFFFRQLSLAMAEDAALEHVSPPRNVQKTAPKKITPRKNKMN